ncbi:MAG: tRNA (adenosine(37)-N6)-threonylcarbamoyltransferase complex dimerization subunit type 1 TsaB [Chlamydiota bacterium]
MNILGIETSTRRASLAVAADGALLAEVVLPGDSNPSAQLLPALDGLLKKCGLVPRDIGGIAAGTGPGSFTGIRIGLATARGLSAARGMPIRGVGGFDNLLAGYVGGDAARVCPLVDAHSYGVYAAVYEREGTGYRRVKAPFVCRPDALPGLVEGEVFFMGPHLGRFRELLAGLFGSRASFDAGDRFPAASTAALLFDGPAALRDDPPGTVAPLYLLPGVRVKSVTRKP